LGKPSTISWGDLVNGPANFSRQCQIRTFSDAVNGQGLHRLNAAYFAGYSASLSVLVVGQTPGRRPQGFSASSPKHHPRPQNPKRPATQGAEAKFKEISHCQLLPSDPRAPPARRPVRIDATGQEMPPARLLKSRPRSGGLRTAPSTKRPRPHSFVDMGGLSIRMFLHRGGRNGRFRSAGGEGAGLRHWRPAVTYSLAVPFLVAARGGTACQPAVTARPPRHRHPRGCLDAIPACSGRHAPGAQGRRRAHAYVEIPCRPHPFSFFEARDNDMSVRGAGTSTPCGAWSAGCRRPEPVGPGPVMLNVAGGGSNTGHVACGGCKSAACSIARSKQRGRSVRQAESGFPQARPRR